MLEVMRSRSSLGLCQTAAEQHDASISLLRTGWAALRTDTCCQFVSYWAHPPPPSARHVSQQQAYGCTRLELMARQHNVEESSLQRRHDRLFIGLTLEASI